MDGKFRFIVQFLYFLLTIKSMQKERTVVLCTSPGITNFWEVTHRFSSVIPDIRSYYSIVVSTMFNQQTGQISVQSQEERRGQRKTVAKCGQSLPEQGKMSMRETDRMHPQGSDTN